MKSAAGARQQPAFDTEATELAMQKEDLKLTAAPGSGGVEVDD
jgi:hypothetical protein